MSSINMIVKLSGIYLFFIRQEESVFLFVQLFSLVKPRLIDENLEYYRNSKK